MKLVRSLLCVALFSLTLAPCLAPASAQSTRTVSRTFDLDPNGTVELDTFTGSVEVKAWDRSSVEVEAQIEGDDQELVDKTALEFDESSGHLAIEVDYDDVEDSQQILGLFSIGDVDHPAAHFTISMPRSARLTVDDFSSEIEVQGLRAGVSLETFSSTIRLRDVKGSVDLETFSGEIDVMDLRGDVQVETFSGDVRLSMTALTGDSRLESFSGDFELILPADAGFELVAGEDAFGDLESEFALTSEEGRRIAGGGGPRIEVETFSGDLRLRKR